MNDMHLCAVWSFEPHEYIFYLKVGRREGREGGRKEGRKEGSKEARKEGRRDAVLLRK